MELAAVSIFSVLESSTNRAGYLLVYSNEDMKDNLGT